MESKNIDLKLIWINLDNIVRSMSSPDKYLIRVKPNLSREKIEEFSKQIQDFLRSGRGAAITSYSEIESIDTIPQSPLITQAITKIVIAKSHIGEQIDLRDVVSDKNYIEEELLQIEDMDKKIEFVINQLNSCLKELFQYHSLEYACLNVKDAKFLLIEYLKIKTNENH